MNRRNFLASSASALLLSRAARAAESCGPGSPWQPSICIAQVDLSDVPYEPQRESQWCWAASTQIIFGYYGYDVSQETIVRTVYGRLVNLPSFNTVTISRLLSREWEADDGSRFRCQIDGLYDFFAGVVAMNNFSIINALRNDRPLYYCNRSHAMVQSAIAYQSGPMGINVVNIGLIDPWPGMGARGPSYGEMTPAHLGGALTYLALPRITPLD